jgi:hypothetical protein
MRLTKHQEQKILEELPHIAELTRQLAGLIKISEISNLDSARITVYSHSVTTFVSALSEYIRGITDSIIGVQRAYYASCICANRIEDQRSEVWYLRNCVSAIAEVVLEVNNEIQMDGDREGFCPSTGE